MSEIPRTYIPSKRAGAPRRRRMRRFTGLRRGGRIFTTGFLAFLLVALAWIAWTTRNTHGMASLIPADQKYQVFMGRFLANREPIANSAVWLLAPEDSLAADLPGLLRDNFGLPEWALNHLVYGPCHVSGRDVAEFGDLLFVTEMSRIGCLAEQFHRFAGVEGDEAGGLHLRRLPDAGVYYAVRGRMLVVSPSRDAVIRALTLQPDQALTEDALARGLGEAGTADLYGKFALSEGDPLGGVFEEVRVLVRFGEESLLAAFSGHLAESWRVRLSGVLGGARPTTLLMPPPGMLQVSANVGKTFEEVCLGLARVLGDGEGRLEEMWQSWEAPEWEEPPGFGPMLARILGPAGPGLRLSWRGVDLNEMLPVPIVVATMDMEPAAAAERFAALPPSPAGAHPWEEYPRYDAESGVVFMPLPGGPNIEPVAAMAGGILLLSNSRAAAGELLASPPDAAALPDPGNLWIRLLPAPAMRAVSDVGMLLAENGMLKGFTPDSFARWAARWTEWAGRVREVAGLGAFQDGDVSFTVQMMMAPPPPALEETAEAAMAAS